MKMWLVTPCALAVLTALGFPWTFSVSTVAVDI